PPVENISRLTFKPSERSDLKPSGILKMRAHELQRENAHAKRNQQPATKKHNYFLCRVCLFVAHLTAVMITFQPIRLRSLSSIDSETSGDKNRSSARVNCSISIATSRKQSNSARAWVLL